MDFDDLIKVLDGFVERVVKNPIPVFLFVSMTLNAYLFSLFRIEQKNNVKLLRENIDNMTHLNKFFSRIKIRENSPKQLTSPDESSEGEKESDDEDGDKPRKEKEE